ncbi:hypothetical protein KPH14_000554 [Odynerus spinipes]|uniref:Retrotransposon gag domain-containing protein n=1 Tax=Odynerus spinipes TaxID=1348599 RepID=A0AAD9R8R0_9HYME|nr:hypothetical protein KPH14_000554 [Odynerus spinipes]
MSKPHTRSDDAATSVSEPSLGVTQQPSKKPSTVDGTKLMMELTQLREDVTRLTRSSNKNSQLYNIVQSLSSELQRLSQKLDSPTQTESQRVDFNDTVLDTHDERNTDTHRRREFTRGISLTDALALIPTFDGNSNHVSQFCRACERARELISQSDESHFVYLLSQKLIGRASRVMLDFDGTSINEFIHELKSNFAARRTGGFYRGELNRVQQHPREHILDYISRVKELRNCIIEAELPESEYSKRLIDDEVMDSFRRGLLPELSMRLESRRCRTVKESFNEAIKIDADIQFRRELTPVKYSFERRENIQPLPPRFNDRNYPRQPMFPTRPAITNRPNVPDIPTCKHCKNRGHTVEECRKLAYMQRTSPPTNSGNGEARPSGNDNRRAITLHKERQALTIGVENATNSVDVSRPSTSKEV